MYKESIAQVVLPARLVNKYLKEKVKSEKFSLLKNKVIKHVNFVEIYV